MSLRHDERHDFYASFGEADIQSMTRPEWDDHITDTVAEYLGTRRRVLDAGCGYGRVSRRLAERGYQTVGLDLSESLMRSGQAAVRRAGTTQLPFVLGDMARLPFGDASFDAVICLWSAFQEILEPADQVTVLSEVWRVLDEDGLALIEGRPPRAEDADLPADRISRDVVKSMEYTQYIHDPETLRSRCAEAGIPDCEVVVRDWGVRERMVLTFRRVPRT